MYRTFRPDLEEPTREDAELTFPMMNVMPVGYVEPLDVTNAVLFLASEEARYITGQNLAVDAGALLRAPALG
jgi:NAD(P)-dependent dehydrogenase (short-subunit alcohol dehydrogenase family)